MTVSKYRRCDECRNKFILPNATRQSYDKKEDFIIYCPKCDCKFGHQITKDEFYEKSKP